MHHNPPPTESTDIIQAQRHTADLLAAMQAAAIRANALADELDHISRQYESADSAYRAACGEFEEAARRHRQALQASGQASAEKPVEALEIGDPVSVNEECRATVSAVEPKRVRLLSYPLHGSGWAEKDEILLIPA